VINGYFYKILFTKYIKITMIPEEKFSNEIWWVLQEIKKERLYSPDGDKNKIDFSIRTSSHTDDNTPPAETQRKLLIKLVEWKAIELRQNLVEILDEVRNKISKMPSSDANPIIELPEPTKPPTKYVITIMQSRFNEIYDRYSQPTSPKISNNIKPPSKPAIRKLLNELVKSRKFGKTEVAFLKFLAKDFEPKTIIQIGNDISSKACKQLKSRIQKRIKNTGFQVETIRADKWGGQAQYQLKYLTQTGNQN